MIRVVAVASMRPSLQRLSFCGPGHTVVDFDAGHGSAARLLLAPSAAARCGDDGTTVLHWMAAAEAAVEHLRCAVEAGADATAKDEEGRLAWEWAAENDGPDGDAAVFLRGAAEARQQAERRASAGGGAQRPPQA